MSEQSTGVTAPGQPVAGVIGLGIMGGAFARNLLKAGFTVIGHDVLEANTQALVSEGVIAAAHARDVAEQSDIVITSLPTASSFHDVISGSNSIATAAKPGLIVIECSTLTIEDKQLACSALLEKGTVLLDCPVLSLIHI